MLTVTTLFEFQEEGSKWKKYGIPAALLGTAGLLYYVGRSDGDDPSESAFDHFSQGAKILYNRGAEKAGQLKDAAVNMWHDSEPTRQDIADATARGLEKAGDFSRSAADATAQAWHDSAPARRNFVDRIQNSWNSHFGS